MIYERLRRTALPLFTFLAFARALRQYPHYSLLGRMQVKLLARRLLTRPNSPANFQLGESEQSAKTRKEVK